MKTRITLKYIFITLIAVVGTWLVHEFAHWATGELLGYEMKMTLNTVSPIDGGYDHVWQRILVSTTGPGITIIQAIFFWMLIMKRPNQYLYPFLFTPFYCRLLASGMNFINLNDEGRISNELGFGTYTIPLIVSVFLFTLLYSATKKMYLKRSFVAWTVVLIMIFSSILILADQAYSIQIL